MRQGTKFCTVSQALVVIGDHQLHPAQAAVGEAARGNSVQKVSASEGPVATPSTSRLPSSFTATATITARLTILPPSRTFR